MSSANTGRNTDFGSLANILFPSAGSFRYASVASENDPTSATGEGSAPNLFIWGTDINVDTCKKQFVDFLLNSRFRIEEAEMDEARLEWPEQSDEPRPLYLTKLQEISLVTTEPFLTINCSHLKEFNPTLYTQLVNHPTEVIQIFDMVANEVFQDRYPEQSESIIISVRPFNTDQSDSIRGLNPAHVNKLITISGMVVRCSSLIPEMVRAFFKCTVCLFTREMVVENGRISEPHVCTACNSKFSFSLIVNRSKFIDRQLVKLQESPDDMPAGQTPATISLVASADQVDRVSPGDRIYVTGIYRALQVRVMARQRKIRSVYRTTIDVIHYRKKKSGRLHDESSSLRFNPERVDRLKELSKDPYIYDRLAKSLCPGIFRHEDVKKGVLLQLFGGTRKEAPGRHTDPKLRHFRAEVNMLLCGDPGTSKSQILQCIHQLVPRGQYTSGKGSSAVGLTAYVTRDVDTRQLVLQTGALVMCDGGICCIDEFDKMSEATRSVLHEVMEQQTLSIAKAGIVCQLNARTSVLAAANPVASEWDSSKNIIENVKMPDTLLSRFDLIFLLLDPNNEDYDRMLARHLVGLYHGRGDINPEDAISHETLKDYIAFARCNIHPKLSDEAVARLRTEYRKLREPGNISSGKGRICAYPRNLESLIRLSEAHAKMRFSPTVEPDDVAEAVRLYGEALMLAHTDPTDGRIGAPI